MDMKKRELLLEGLDCASCSLKIEEEMNAVEGLKAKVNFVTKTLSLEYNDAFKEEDLHQRVQSVVHKHEPSVKILEKNPKVEEEVYLLEGLGCANCALKMEEALKDMPALKDVHIDFTLKKLRVSPKGEGLEAKDLLAIQKIVSEIEEDTKVVPWEKTKEAKEEGLFRSLCSAKKALLPIVGSVLLMLLGMLVPLGSLGKFALFLAAYLLVGGEILLRAARNISRGQVFDENFLMAIATLGAFAIGEYSEGVAVMLFYQVGELFQSLAVERSRKSIGALMDIRPDTAHVIRHGETFKVSPEKVAVGEFILVKPGERVPLDGEVVEGYSSLDTSALTGESMLRDVAPGQEVLGGFINSGGLLKVQVKKGYGESAVAKILDLVENAASKKAPTESFITKFAKYYTPVVVVSALLIAVIPPLILGEAFSPWIYRALVFLVISCPCALVVSIPLGFFGGIGGASKRGILIKGGNYLEALNDVHTVVFDKTGTLTKGVFKVQEVLPKEGISQEELLEVAAHAEGYSNHPIARSVMEAYGKAIEANDVTIHEELHGFGVRVMFRGQEIFMGNKRLMENQKVLVVEPEEVGTHLYVARNGQYLGAMVIADELKNGVKETMAGLKALGVERTIMLTGDRQRVGEIVGSASSVDEVYGDLLPQDKVERFEALKASHGHKGKLVFVGDGINDAPVLAMADIGVSMGALGSDAAIEASDVVLMTDEPLRLVSAMKIARRTRTIVWQNIFFALGVKGVFLLLGALGFATMWEAVFADVGVTVLAVFNAMRVMNTKDL